MEAVFVSDHTLSADSLSFPSATIFPFVMIRGGGMAIGNYAAASSGFVKELAMSLTSADVNALAVELKRNGLRAWVRWMADREPDVMDYVAATPRQREKKKAWADPSLRSKLVLAAMTHCQAAHALLAFLRDHEAALTPGGSYRDTAALAGILYWDLVATDVPYWPADFASLCPSPFPELAD